MNYPRITNRGDKGVLRWDQAACLWRWVSTGPYFRVVTLESGRWQVNRIKL